MTQTLPPKRPTVSGIAADSRKAISDWLRDIASRRALTVAKIVEITGVDRSTVYRMWNGERSSRLESVARVASHLGEPMPPGFAPTPAAAPGAALREAQAECWSAPDLELRPESPSQSIWRIKSRALEMAGVMPGDIARLDKAQTAQAGDIVLARIYDFERGEHVTKLRQFDGHSLVVRTMDPALQERAMPIDGERVAIVGRIDRLLRRMT